MSDSYDQISQQLKGRHRKSTRLKYMSMGALALAAAFLLIFFADMLSKGLPAFQQAMINIEVNYTEEASTNGRAAVDRDFSTLISRSVVRVIPLQMRNDPSLLGTTQNRWVLADGEVDQYLKGNRVRLDDEEKARIDRLVEEGKVEMQFNSGFFSRGDSKMPELAGILSAVVGTVMTMIVTLAIAFPIGVMTAVYLEEFAPDNRLTQLVEININNLAAIPSILFGLLGLAIFINFFGVPRSSPLVGGMTLALMTLPVIIISTRTALRSVPESIRHAAFGVGCSRWQVVKDHVLPLAMPGIMTGSIIGLAQAMGETAPLIIVGMVAFIPDVTASFTEAATVMPAQVFTWSGEPDRAFVEKTAGGIIVLLAVLISLNAAAVLLRKKFERRW
ncbi:phosphate ABC transporter permease PstA [Halomonas sp. ISL-60]|uniref:phosphate ABC transporter permease PstA n=1 Tax=unclassified Halomonas TaxID=2609666 RepID=UPI0007D9E3E0|nr:MULTISPECIES: phosphate ABC transporter permease PstA [unclassified Halomonas]MBT2770769.1 phosphate ABC transporter permease PstA [Halomonas sp. ISL-60]MBT2788828.1 phosphate ABC transporter permease PstA [Halomonas sp. ISL-106]MBT2799547.1 phosphate ABC transporter permease PstA [Halomonas sp. ISL-104]MBT2803867.1 phosphate ABC transporter permease PstA [Halomonas sp. ISL-56]OAL60459.1 phosphate ABC transporter, permease protein PstA [Halomonas sp. ALS9]